MLIIPIFKKVFNVGFIIRVIGLVGGGVTMAAMMIVITADITFRLMYIPVLGAVELTQVIMVMTISLGLANTQREKQHVFISIFWQRFPGRIQRLMNIFTLSLSLLFFILLTWESIVATLYTYRLQSMWWNLPIPLWIAYLFLAIGFFLLSMELLVELIHQIKYNNEKHGVSQKV